MAAANMCREQWCGGLSCDLSEDGEALSEGGEALRSEGGEALRSGGF